MYRNLSLICSKHKQFGAGLNADVDEIMQPC